MTTELMYMQDFDVVECTAKIVSVTSTDDGQIDVILDRTCFYPRGGGQDWDTGLIGEFTVKETRLDEQGTVHHIGEGQVQSGAEVHAKVDVSRRNNNTRLHSAGHVVDMAVDSLNLSLTPQKGAHYPHMSFVEYSGTIEDVDSLKNQIQDKIDSILQSDTQNTILFVTPEELAKICRHVPANLPTNKPTRVVLYGNFGVPCGGTHVKKLQDIGKIEITKIKSKKGVTKVSYRVEGIN